MHRSAEKKNHLTTFENYTMKNSVDHVYVTFVRPKWHSREITYAQVCSVHFCEKKKKKVRDTGSLIYVGEDKGHLCFRRELIQRWKTLITLSRRTMVAPGMLASERIDGDEAQLISIIRGNSRMQVEANRSA